MSDIDLKLLVLHIPVYHSYCSEGFFVAYILRENS